MKALSAFFALVTLMFLSASLHADTIVASLNTGLGTGVLVQTPILNGEQFTYTNLTSVTAIPGIGGITLPIDNTRLTTFIATYIDALGTAGVLNVTAACVQVTILGPAVPCENLAFSFTNLTLGNASLAAALGANVNIVGNVANIGFDGSVALGGATIDFNNPPSGPGGPGNGGGSGPGTSPVPEPGSLSLMATGLLGAAGAIRRKFATA